ncbi:MAG: MATE family efflux transporter [Chitinophagaceae bacterium]|nr:MAG: MATE family efflux transporter [Chitinophagaceae bacterium]
MSSLQVEVTYKQILKIAGPISLAMLVPNLNFIINNIFLGNLSEAALAVASITGVYYLIFSSIGYGLNNGLQALIARRAGENRPGEIGKIFHQGILVAMGIALLAVLLTYTVAPLVLRAAVHKPEDAEAALSYLHIRIWGLPFLYIYQMRNALLVGTNNSKLLIAGTLIEATANVVFDYGLIFGKLGMPRVGFNGAAYASIIAEFMGMFAIFIVIRLRGLDRKFSLFGKIKSDPENIRAILKLSGPLIFQHAFAIISWLFFYILIERNSTQTGLAISNTMRTIFGAFGVTVWAFAATSNAMVSNIIGQGRREDVVRCIGMIMRVSTGIALAAFLFLFFFPHAYLSIYGRGAAFVDAGAPVVRVVASALMLMSMATIWLQAVTGTGNSRVTFLIELAAIFGYVIYVFLVLEHWKLSLVWAWGSEFLYWTIILILSVWYIRSGKWEKIHL